MQHPSENVGFLNGNGEANGDATLTSSTSSLASNDSDDSRV